MKRGRIAYISLFILLIALLSAAAVGEDAMEEQGYRFLSYLRGVRLMGQFKEQTLDISLYEGRDGEGGQYALTDRERGITVYHANNSQEYLGPIKKDVLTGSDVSVIHWNAGDACPYPDAVDALHNLQRAYDYYRDVLGWTPEANGQPFEAVVVTDVHVWRKKEGDSGEDLMNNIQTMYSSSDNLAWFAVGQNLAGSHVLSGSPEIMGHEFTHMVLWQKGIDKNELQSAAIHEGYSDVMGICIGDEDDSWVYGDGYNFLTKRDLKKAKVKRFKQLKLGKEDEHYNGTLLGYGAYLMNKRDIANQIADNPFSEDDIHAAEGRQGAPLDRELTARLFYRSMEYLHGDVSFRDVGSALHRAAGNLSRSYDARTGAVIMTEEQARRVDCVLVYIGILDLEKEIFEEHAPQRAEDAEKALKEFLENDLTGSWNVMSTSVLRDSEERGEAVLSGLLSANMYDYDGDRVPELLASGFHVLPGHEIGEGIPDELVLTMTMYEADGGNVVKGDERHLLLPGITEVMGMYGSSASCFRFRTDSGVRIGFETYYGVNESTVTLAVYSYDGSRFVFQGGCGCQQYGGGDILARGEYEEGIFENTATCSEWWELMLPGGARRSTWGTGERWDAEAHDWAMPGPEDRRHFFELYRDAAKDLGVTAAQDGRIAPFTAGADAVSWEEEHNARYLRQPKDIYQGTRDLTGLWSISSRQLMGGPLELIREDTQGTLDAWR